MATLWMRFKLNNDTKTGSVVLPTDIVSSAAHSVTITAGGTIQFTHPGSGGGAGAILYKVNNGNGTTITAGAVQRVGSNTWNLNYPSKTVSGSWGGGTKLTVSVGYSLPNGATSISGNITVSIKVSNTTALSALDLGTKLNAADMNKLIRICGFTNNILSAGTKITRPMLAAIGACCGSSSVDTTKPTLVNYNAMVRWINEGNAQALDRPWDPA